MGFTHLSVRLSFDNPIEAIAGNGSIRSRDCVICTLPREISASRAGDASVGPMRKTAAARQGRWYER
ncbi:MAG TPA: hypothetical protein DIW77_18835 [Chromatiaceae bacterium]|nr:MAG: hypothetical protein N838_05790 [Thiohalocapsa sp. PB-PSB1]HCS92023.1 hypothetical protein [Chromatiaceae bacterium]